MLTGQPIVLAEGHDTIAFRAALATIEVMRREEPRITHVQAAYVWPSYSDESGFLGDVTSLQYPMPSSSLAANTLLDDLHRRLTDLVAPLPRQIAAAARIHSRDGLSLLILAPEASFFLADHALWGDQRLMARHVEQLRTSPVQPVFPQEPTAHERLRPSSAFEALFPAEARVITDALAG